MTKQELSSLLKSLGVPVNEGITSDKNTNEYPRIVFWPYLEEDEMASGNEYQNVVTRSRSLPAHLSMTNIKSYGRSCENRGFTLNFSTNMWKKILYSQKHGTPTFPWM